MPTAAQETQPRLNGRERRKRQLQCGQELGDAKKELGTSAEKTRSSARPSQPAERETATHGRRTPAPATPEAPRAGYSCDPSRVALLIFVHFRQSAILQESTNRSIFQSTNAEGPGSCASAERLPNSLRIVSSTGSIVPARLARMTKSHSGSNFFQPAAYAEVAQAGEEIVVRRRAAHDRSPPVELAVRPAITAFELRRPTCAPGGRRRGACRRDPSHES